MNFTITIEGAGTPEYVLHEVSEHVRELVGRGIVVTRAEMRHGLSGNVQVAPIPIPYAHDVTPRGKLRDDVMDDDEPLPSRGRLVADATASAAADEIAASRKRKRKDG